MTNHPTNRFDYVRYDDEALSKSVTAKVAFQGLESWINLALPDGRAKALVLTKLEESYMWVGKAIRDEQLQQRGAQLQEQRGEE